uniref:Uncharacterized protein n=1 Tax=Erpetoichthys calabaricus TaxID=27687 RepID=A0A8C4RYM3_ERPCA
CISDLQKRPLVKQRLLLYFLCVFKLNFLSYSSTKAAGTLNSPPPTVMVPVSVLKHPGTEGNLACSILSSSSSSFSCSC